MTQADVERCRRAMRAAQKAYMYAGGNSALNQSDYDRAGIEAIMRETRLIDAEALGNYAEAIPHGGGHIIVEGSGVIANWLRTRAGETA